MSVRTVCSCEGGSGVCGVSARANYTLRFVCADVCRMYFSRLLLLFKCRIESVLFTIPNTPEGSVSRGLCREGKIKILSRFAAFLLSLCLCLSHKDLFYKLNSFLFYVFILKVVAVASRGPSVPWNIRRNFLVHSA